MVVVFCLLLHVNFFLSHWFCVLSTFYCFCTHIEPISFFSCLWSSNVSLWLKVLLNYFCMFNCIFFSRYISIFEEQFVFLCTIDMRKALWHFFVKRNCFNDLFFYALPMSICCGFQYSRSCWWFMIHNC